ncbi:hypothetical protein [Embleya sp. AB8]|uniref:hypothetical protein n=1 Tax=Embleya sp. AB8 TaxID=3156304 RepID=UPI003C775B11
MATAQSIDVPARVENPAITVLAQFGGLTGHAFEAAVRYSAAPPDTPLDLATLRELLDVGGCIAARVLHELAAAGLAVARYLRDAVTGRMLGRRMEWTGPRVTGGAPEEAAAPPPEAAATPVADPAVQALELLVSLADADDRLAFKERELRTLVPFVVDRLAAGDAEAEVFRELTEDLPRPGRTIKTGLLHYRLTKAPKPPMNPPVIPPQALRPRLVECADCRRPGPDLAPGDLCRHCRTGTIPAPLDGAARARRLEQLADSNNSPTRTTRRSADEG